MQILEGNGKEHPTLRRVLFQGGALTGKTTSVLRLFPKSNALFISTDGNAPRQGYSAIRFEFGQTFNELRTNMKQMFQLVRSAVDRYDLIVFDLIEDYDEYAQTLLREDLSDPRKVLRAWGKINALYKDMNSFCSVDLSEQKIVFISREVEIIEQSLKEKKVTYRPALRSVLANQVLKDPDAIIRFERNGGRVNSQLLASRFEVVGKTIIERLEK